MHRPIISARQDVEQGGDDESRHLVQERIVASGNPYHSTQPPLDGSDIRSRQFRRTARLKPGYDRDQVDRFQAQVAALVDALRHQINELRNENQSIRHTTTNPYPRAGADGDVPVTPTRQDGRRHYRTGRD